MKEEGVKMAKKDGGAAFPTEYHRGDRTGMTLRDWFAGQAMAAIIGKTPLYGANNTTEKTHTAVSTDDEYAIMAAVAAGAYGYADAMIEARNKGKGE